LKSTIFSDFFIHFSTATETIVSFKFLEVNYIEKFFKKTVRNSDVF
jgi:hypothetical protein